MGADTMLECTILSPIVSQYDWNLYRVPLRRQGNKYTIYVDNFFTRVFDEDSLPDEIKTVLVYKFRDLLQQDFMTDKI